MYIGIYGRAYVHIFKFLIELDLRLWYKFGSSGFWCTI